MVRSPEMVGSGHALLYRRIVRATMNVHLFGISLSV